MPKLPEVEAVRRLVARRLVGRLITAVAAVADPICSSMGSRRSAAAVGGRRVQGVRRLGYLWVELDRRRWPLFHLGRVVVYGSAHDAAHDAGCVTGGL